MARRKSMNKRLSRYSRSSVESAILDADMDVVDDDQPFWWQHLENNTIRYSMRSKAFNETSRHLDSAFSISDSEAERQGSNTEAWWKVLDDSRPMTVSQKSLNRTKNNTPQTKAEKSNLKSPDSESEEEIRPRRRKFALHEVAKRRSYGENAFLKALNSSKESVVSEPTVKLYRIDFKDCSVAGTKTRAASEIRTSSEARGEEKVHEDSDNQSENITGIVKARPFFGKRTTNRNKNAFEDVLNNTTEDVLKSPFKTPLKSPLKSKSSRASILKTQSRDSIVNIAPIGQRRQSRLTISFEGNSDESLHLPGPKAQSTIIEATPVKVGKLAESDSDTEILKPKSRMLKRLRKSLGPNVFEDILNEDNNEPSIISVNTETKKFDPSMSPIKEPSVDIDINKQKSNVDFLDDKEEAVLLEKSQEVTGSKSVGSIKQGGEDQRTPTSSVDTRMSSSSSKFANSDNKRNVESSVNNNANTSISENKLTPRSSSASLRRGSPRSEKNKILDSNSKNRISEAPSLSNTNDTQKETQLNRETSTVNDTVGNQDVLLVSNLMKDKNNIQNDSENNNGNDQLILRLSSDTSDSAPEEDMIAETSVTEHVNSEFLQKRRSKRSSTLQRMRRSSETSKVEENEINVNISLNEKRDDSTAERRITRGRLSTKNITEFAEEDSPRSKGYSLSSESNHVILSVDRADSNSTTISNVSIQKAVLTRNKRSSRNRSQKTSNIILEEKVREDEGTIEESFVQQSEILADRSRTTNLIKTPEKVTMENAEEDEEVFSISKQNNESVKSKKSTLIHQRERTSSRTIINEQAEESLRKDTDHSSTSKQDVSSVNNKRSILNLKSLRLILNKIPDETIKDVTTTKEEVLNTSGQTDVSSRSRRHTSENRNKATISDMTSDEPNHISNFTTSTEGGNTGTEDSAVRDVTVGENKNQIDSNESKMSSSIQEKNLNVLRKRTSPLHDSSKTENSRVTGKRSENYKMQTNQNSLIEHSREEQDEQCTEAEDHTEEEGGGNAKEEAADVKTCKKPPTPTSGIATSVNDEDDVVDITEMSGDEEQLATSQGRDDLQKLSRPSPVRPTNRGTENQSEAPKKSVLQLSQTINAEKKFSETERNRESHVRSANNYKTENLHKSRTKFPNSRKNSILKNVPNVPNLQSTIDTFFKERPLDKTIQALSNSEEALKFKKKLEDIKKQAMDKVEARLRNKSSVISTQEKPNRPKKIPKQFAKKTSGNEKQQKEVNKAYLMNGKVYKPPRLPRPKPWATDRLYQFLWKAMEPKYGMSTRVKSEKFILRLADAVTVIRKAKKYEQYEELLTNLMKEMARLGIIRTRKDFHNFSYDFLPNEFWVKVTPMLLPGNKKNIPYDTSTLYEPLLDS